MMVVVLNATVYGVMKRYLKKKRYTERRKNPGEQEHTRQLPRSTKGACQRCVSPVETTSRDVSVYLEDVRSMGQGKIKVYLNCPINDCQGLGPTPSVRAEKQNIWQGRSKGIVIRENFEPEELSTSFFEPL